MVSIGAMYCRGLYVLTLVCLLLSSHKAAPEPPAPARYSSASQDPGHLASLGHGLVQFCGKKCRLFLEVTDAIKTGGGKSQTQAPACSYGSQFVPVGSSACPVVLSDCQPCWATTRRREIPALCRLLLIPMVINILSHITLSGSASLMGPRTHTNAYERACVSSLILSHLPFHCLCRNLPLYIPTPQTLYMLCFLTGVPPLLSLAFV